MPYSSVTAEKTHTEHTNLNFYILSILYETPVQPIISNIQKWELAETCNLRYQSSTLFTGTNGTATARASESI